MINSHKVISLFVHFVIYLLDECICLNHELLRIIESILPLADNSLIEINLALQGEFFSVEHSFGQVATLTMTAAPRSRHGPSRAHQCLLPLHGQIQELLHFEIDVIRELLVLEVHVAQGRLECAQFVFLHFVQFVATYLHLFIVT